LFCKRWCHYGEHRVVPHRLLNYWDQKPHRVSRQAAAFLDEVWTRPILHLGAINPLLYEGLPALRGARALRAQAARLLAAALDVGSDSEGVIGTARVAVDSLVALGPRRVYLCVSEELYSMADLLGAQAGGEVVPELQRLVEALKIATGQSLTPHSTPSRFSPKR
jgi:hypothetical protein